MDTSRYHNITFEKVQQYFNLPIKEAADKLLISVSFLKRRCRKLNINKWPFRKIHSLETKIDNYMEKYNENESDENNGKKNKKLLIKMLTIRKQIDDIYKHPIHLGKRKRLDYELNTDSEPEPESGCDIQHNKKLKFDKTVILPESNDKLDFGFGIRVLDMDMDYFHLGYPVKIEENDQELVQRMKFILEEEILSLKRSQNTK